MLHYGLRRVIIALQVTAECKALWTWQTLTNSPPPPLRLPFSVFCLLVSLQSSHEKKIILWSLVLSKSCTFQKVHQQAHRFAWFIMDTVMVSSLSGVCKHWLTVPLFIFLNFQNVAWREGTRTKINSFCFPDGRRHWWYHQHAVQLRWYSSIHRPHPDAKHSKWSQPTEKTWYMGLFYK